MQNRFDHITQPPVMVIEYFNEETNCFVLAEDNRKVIRNNKKDAVVLFFANYDKEPDSPYYGAVKQYYDSSNAIFMRCYQKLSKKFNVFRILIDDSLQILFSLQRININFLSENQIIQHLMIHGHSNNLRMALDFKDDQFNLLSVENNLMMTNIFDQLAKNATIALFGCLTGAGEINMTKKLSEQPISKGRIIFGSLDLADLIHYVDFTYQNKSIPFLFFSNGLDKNHVAAYKNGVKIVDGEWNPRAKL